MLDRLVEISEVHSSVNIGFVIPVFSFLTDFVQLLNLLFVKGVAFEFFVLCEVKLGEVSNMVIFEEI